MDYVRLLYYLNFLSWRSSYPCTYLQRNIFTVVHLVCCSESYLNKYIIKIYILSVFKRKFEPEPRFEPRTSKAHVISFFCLIIWFECFTYVRSVVCNSTSRLLVTRFKVDFLLWNVALIRSLLREEISASIRSVPLRIVNDLGSYWVLVRITFQK